MKWEWTCPCCGTEFESEFTIDFIKEHIGATTDCPECNALLMIEEDCTCSDFGKELVRRYSEMGLNVSNEEANNSCIRM